MNTHHEEANREKVLRLMAEKYPTKEIVYEKIVYLRSQLMLPKGTEHFMSDLHGAYDSFFHILNNCSGVIKEKVDYCFGERMTEEDKAEFCTLIYYPREKVEQLAAEGKNTAIWYQQNLANLLELTKLMSWKFPASKVYSYIPKRYESVIVELMNTRPEQDEAQLFYYKQLIETIVEIGGGTDYIEAFSVLIKRLAVERIHIVGDFFDRGDRPDGILDLLMEHPSVDIQWGNHDVLWMGAALGSEVCIAGVIRNSLRYRNTDVLERGYGISLRPLSTFASRIYPDENPIKAAERAITMMMFKLEGALIRRNPDFRMEDRLLLDKIDFRSSYVTLVNGRRVELESAYFPTIDDGTDCYELTEEERHIIEDLRSYFLESKVLQRHVDYLYQRGSMYTRYNGNLLFHACVLLDEEGEFRTVTYKGKEYRGRAWMDFCEEKAREAWNAHTQEGLDFMYFLWCGLLAPTSGRSFTTFE
ncbi:MAG: fructose-bisphosphatase class III, partial [Selenomonas artemidis]